MEVEVMTNNEIADKLEAESERLFQAAGGTKITDGKQHGIVLGLSVAAEYYRSLPDPTPSEPEYGWWNLAEDLRVWPVCCLLIQYGHTDEYLDLIRGACVRLMREKGFSCAFVHPFKQTGVDQFDWYYEKASNSLGHRNPAPVSSEPAAYRDMLKHAGIIEKQS